jgi:hypothetical protein
MAVALCATGTVALAGNSEAATVVVGKVTAVPASGPEANGTKVITLTGSGFKAGNTVKVGTAGVDTASGIQFSLAACAATATTSGVAVIDVAVRTVPSATKLVVTVPSLTAGAAAVTQKWNVCVYNTASPNVLIDAGTYSSLPAPTIGAANSPAAGSVAGGDVVTITGTGFTKASTVKFGTVASSKVVFTDSTTVTAVAPSAPAGTVNVVVTTEGGTNAAPGTATFDDYLYQNAIVVSPTTGDGSVGNAIDITGVGFSTITAPSVVFTRAGMTSATDDLTKCTDLQIVSDTELICTTPAMDGTTLPNGAFIIVVTSDDTAVAPAATFQSVLSSGAAYNVAPF